MYTKKYKNLTTEYSNGVLRIGIDKENSNTNVLSTPVLADLSDLLTTCACDSSLKTVVIISNKKIGFIAGADINEFSSFASKTDGLTYVGLGQRVARQISSLSATTIAAIHGFAFGGGLEIALACKYRIAMDGTKLGLPEVQLGIHPGFGGTINLPKIVGVFTAMDLMLTGKTIDARQAAKMKLVDIVVPKRQFESTINGFIKNPPKLKNLPLLEHVLNFGPVRMAVSAMLNHKLKSKVSKTHYPAPYELVNLWNCTGSNDDNVSYACEQMSVVDLAMSDTAKGLSRVFKLKEKLKAIGKEASKAVDPVKHVHVIGTGVMGGDIIIWCAFKGLKVTVQDRKPENIAKLMLRANKFLSKKIKDKRKLMLTLDNIIPDNKGCGVLKADIVIEAVVEDLNVKKKIFSEIETKLKPGAFIGTNTSSIVLEDLCKDMKDPSKLVGLHFFNPVTVMPLIEIVVGKQTSEEVKNKAVAFSSLIDRLPLTVKSHPGFLVNRVLMPYILEAVKLYSMGLDANDIDSAALDYGMPMGPLHLADVVGLDVCKHVAENLQSISNIKIPTIIAKKIDSGELGVKTGCGFFNYKDGKSDFKRCEVISGGEISDKLIYAMMFEAIECLKDGIVEDKDMLDAGMIFGTGYAPFTGGISKLFPNHL